MEVSFLAGLLWFLEGQFGLKPEAWCTFSKESRIASGGQFDSVNEVYKYITLQKKSNLCPADLSNTESRIR